MVEMTEERRERVRAWVEALRSDEYVQGKCTLRGEAPDRPERFCCLGVACDLSGLGEWSGTAYCVGGHSSATTLPRPVADWYGLPGGDPSVRAHWPHLDRVALSTLNDGMGYTFDQIADCLEKEFLT
jgi:hypothetical protein